MYRKATMDKTASIFITSLLTDTIRVAPNELTNKFRDLLLEIIKKRCEGVCSKHGYIRPDSIEIIKVSAGNVRMVSLNGDVIFTVQYRADVCNPAVGTLVRGTVANINKFGILAEAYISTIDDKGVTQNTPVISIIVTKQGVGIVGNVDLEKIKIGDEVNVEILGRKFELNDKKISAVGKIVQREEDVVILKEDDEELLNDDDVSVLDDLEEEEEEDEEENDLDNDEVDDDELIGGSISGDEESIFDLDDTFDDSDLEPTSDVEDDVSVF